MANHGVALLLAILTWWFSTGLVLMLCALPKKTFAWSMIGASLVLAAAVYGLAHSAWETGPGAPYVAFLSALGVWGWIEMSFLMGIVTGPRTVPCPENVQGWPRFQMALQALLYHELMIVFWAGLIVMLTWRAPNQIGTFAFLILMAMRISAKLNIFLGVPNLTDEFLPQRLVYLKSYFRKGQISSLFPATVGAAALVAIFLAQKALGASGAEASGFALLFSLIALAILEHLFMVFPIPDAVLWRWAFPAPKQGEKNWP